MPAPQRIAPHAFAISGDVLVGEDELATGRFILLHDPAGNDAWGGTFRCVTFARADIEADMAADPVLPSVGWSWLTEALEAYGSGYTAGERQRHGRTIRGFRRDGGRRIGRADRGACLLDAADRRAHARHGLACGGVVQPVVRHRRPAAAGTGSHPPSAQAWCRVDLYRPDHPRRDPDRRHRRRDAGAGHTAGAAPRAPRPAAAGRRHPRAAARHVRAHRRRHGSDRPRCRASVRLPLLPAGLPRPGPPRGLRHAPDRSHRVRQPRAARHRLRRQRVDPARRDPGPDVPRRGRPLSRVAVRHRARRPAAQPPPRRVSPRWSSTTSASAWPRSSRPPTGRPVRCPSHGSSMPPSTSRCWSSSAT